MESIIKILPGATWKWGEQKRQEQKLQSVPFTTVKALDGIKQR